MSLLYIIDGHNVINHPLFARIHKKIEDKKSALLDFIRLNRVCGKSSNRVVVVFDGYAEFSQRQTLSAGMDVIFSREETADDRIKEIVESAVNPKTIVVVSDDKEIVFFVRALGAKPLSAEEFISRAPCIRKYQTCRDKKSREINEDAQPKVSYVSMQKINQEMRKIWLE